MAEPIDRAAIRRRTEAASEGPWEAQGSHVEGDRVIAVACTLSRANDDAEFIAHARSDIPTLLAALEEAERRIAAVHEYVTKPLTWQESLSRDFSGKPFARMVDRDEIAVLLEVVAERSAE